MDPAACRREGPPFRFRRTRGQLRERRESGRSTVAAVSARELHVLLRINVPAPQRCRTEGDARMRIWGLIEIQPRRIEAAHARAGLCHFRRRSTCGGSLHAALGVIAHSRRRRDQHRDHHSQQQRPAHARTPDSCREASGQLSSSFTKVGWIVSSNVAAGRERTHGYIRTAERAAPALGETGGNSRGSHRPLDDRLLVSTVV